MTKTWFITGASKGFGRQWAEAALERGDTVAATARKLETLDALVDTYGKAVLPMQLDVTDRSADFDAVKRAADHFGKLDVVINNAGYGHFGMIEELTEDEVRSQLETNFFGALWVTQAALPIMRAGLRSHHSDIEPRWHHRLPGDRCLPRVEVGSGGLLAVAGARGCELRHQGDADRARRIFDRLGWPVGEAQRGESGLRRRLRSAKPLMGSESRRPPAA